MVAKSERTSAYPFQNNDPALSEAYHKFQNLDRLFQGKYGLVPLTIPEPYIFDVFELVDKWGPKDKETKVIRTNPNGKPGEPIEEYYLYRDERKELVAKVAAHSWNNAIVYANSLDHAKEFLTMLFETHNKRMEKLAVKRAEVVIYPSDNETSNGRVLDLNGKADRFVGSGIKAVRRFEILPNAIVLKTFSHQR